jgi:hypothetical protein
VLQTHGLVHTFQINQLFNQLTPLQSLALAVSQQQPKAHADGAPKACRPGSAAPTGLAPEAGADAGVAGDCDEPGGAVSRRPQPPSKATARAVMVRDRNIERCFMKQVARGALR